MNTKSGSNTYLRISLGVEELALLLALINRPDLGRNLLVSTNETVIEEQMSTSLTAAGHSLVARGVCRVTDNGSLSITQEFEQAIFPLASFDRLFYITIIQDGKREDATIHLINQRYFTSHITRQGFIHHLEHGSSVALPDYVASVFGNFGEDTPINPFSLEIKMGVLGQVQDYHDDPVHTQQLLVENGWSQNNASMYIDDQAHQSYRGTILRLEANSNTKIEEIEHEDRRVIMLLKGLKHSWLFEFPSADDNAIGKASLISRRDFERVLAEFVM